MQRDRAQPNLSINGVRAMRYISMIRVNEHAGLVPGEQLLADMGRLVGELTRAGKLIDTAGLCPTSQGKRVRLTHGRLRVTDGPFTEAKEVIGGYAILEAESMDEAVDLTKRFLEVHGDDWEIECEVRRLDGPDFGANT
jgi:hypothetical protein